MKAVNQITLIHLYKYFPPLQYNGFSVLNDNRASKSLTEEENYSKNWVTHCLTRKLIISDVIMMVAQQWLRLVYPLSVFQIEVLVAEGNVVDLLTQTVILIILTFSYHINLIVVIR